VHGRRGCGGVGVDGRVHRRHRVAGSRDLRQVVVGTAVIRAGIPVRVWCWPGNYSDSALIRQVKHDVRAWNLARVVWVADRGFSSADNRRYLQRGGQPADDPQGGIDVLGRLFLWPAATHVDRLRTKAPIHK
jgi:hypothetical protein